MTELNKKALNGLAQFIVIFAACIFVPAWTLYYWEAWVFLGIFSASVLAITLYLMKFDPKLLERRLNAGPFGEKERTQKIIMICAAVAFIVLVVLSSFDHRFSWSHVSSNVVEVGDFLVMVGLCTVFLVFKENTFTSGTIDIHEGQKVISSGPYALVRHPMYTGGIIFLFGIPLALGSYWGLLAFVPLLAVIMWRSIEEERFLVKNLRLSSQM